MSLLKSANKIAIKHNLGLNSLAMVKRKTKPKQTKDKRFTKIFRGELDDSQLNKYREEHNAWEKDIPELYMLFCYDDNGNVETVHFFYKESDALEASYISQREMLESADYFGPLEETKSRIRNYHYAIKHDGKFGQDIKHNIPDSILEPYQNQEE